MGDKSIRVVTWNVNRRGAYALDALKGLAQPDVLTLQEVTFNQREDFEERLRVMGFKCCPDSQHHRGGKRYGNLIAVASRWTIDLVEPRYSKAKPPWCELLVQASVYVDGRSFLVINVHIPNGSNYGWKKIDTFNALRDVVSKAKGKPCIVAGDFNEPQLIPLQDGGRLVTWGQEWNARKGRFACWERWRDKDGQSGTGEKWDAAVRWIFEKHDEHNLRHACWEAHGHGVMPVSHVTRGKARWFDHMFVSPDFRVEQCEYLHKVRLEARSDHSALSARLVLDGRQRRRRTGDCQASSTDLASTSRPAGSQFDYSLARLITLLDEDTSGELGLAAIPIVNSASPSADGSPLQQTETRPGAVLTADRLRKHGKISPFVTRTRGGLVSTLPAAGRLETLPL